MVRDSWSAWKLYTLFEAVAGFLAIASLTSSQRRESFFGTARNLVATYTKTRVRRHQLSETCAVEVHGDSDRILIFVPGGAWCHGDDARLWRLHAASFAASVVVVVEYTGYPRCSGSEMISDTELAIQWTVKSFPDARIQVLAHSAGAHLTAMAMLRGHCDGIDSVILCSGVYDLQDHLLWEQQRHVADVSALAAAFPTEQHRRDASPLILAQRLDRLPPFPSTILLVHGLDDIVAPPRSTNLFADALTRLVGDPVDRRIYHGTAHIDYLFDAVLPTPSSPLRIHHLLREQRSAAESSAPSE